MINKIKKYLGLEGPKIVIDIDTIENTTLFGNLKISSFQEAIIDQIEFSVVEQYSFSRSKHGSKDYFILGELIIDGPFYLVNKKTEEISFQLKYNPLLSKIDKLANKLTMLKPLVGFAKILKGVQSTYLIQVKAKVSGSQIPAYQELILKNI